jgi:hypothetical protein
VKGYVGGQWTLVSGRRGLCRVRGDALHAVNALAGMSVFTLWDLVPVEAGETVAKAKITPLAMPEALVKQGGGARLGRGRPRPGGRLRAAHVGAWRGSISSRASASASNPP